MKINIYSKINSYWHQIEYIILWRYFEQSTVVEAVEIENWGFLLFIPLKTAVIYKFPISGYTAKSANSSTLNKIGLALNSDFCKGFRPKNSTKRLTQSDLLFRWPSFADIDSEWFLNCFEIPKVTYWHNNSPMVESSGQTSFKTMTWVGDLKNFLGVTLIGVLLVWFAITKFIRISSQFIWSSTHFTAPCGVLNV